jgi:hypothetical protein
VSTSPQRSPERAHPTRERDRDRARPMDQIVRILTCNPCSSSLRPCTRLLPDTPCDSVVLVRGMLQGAVLVVDHKIAITVSFASSLRRVTLVDVSEIDQTPRWFSMNALQGQLPVHACSKSSMRHSPTHTSARTATLPLPPPPQHTHTHTHARARAHARTHTHTHTHTLTLTHTHARAHTQTRSRPISR